MKEMLNNIHPFFNQIIFNLFLRTMPGPPVVVCKGDQVIIDVINKLEEATATLHFHGLL